MSAVSFGGGLCPPSETSPQDSVAPAKPALPAQLELFDSY
jgi:hypothetical protein